ncbi:MAG: tetratricopeptide repeat protein [Cyanosarcina radialis HA8281-LM2]|jgi:tetratricopeptide (TPR) repeat protein|nr:tetratricopeptide repeat protein [Cyanosarcina radialis HA8281-LM2]
MTTTLLSGRYKIIEVLGRGGFGITYLAQDTDSSNSLCAVKQLNPYTADLEAAKQLFQREAEILKLLKEAQQIPKFFDYFEEGDNCYIVEEYVNGKSLDRLPLNYWTEHKAIFFLWEILSILQPLHERQIIHRDIKPANLILRDKDSKLVLIDFGAVKQIDRHQISMPSTRIITPGYSPPEQEAGTPQLNSDIYAVGMTAIQLLSGTIPKSLPQDEAGNIIWKDRVKVSDRLTDILDKMVRSHWEERYQRVEEVLKDLHQIEELPLVTPKPRRPVPSSGKFLVLSKLKFWHVPVALMAIVTLGAIAELIYPILRPWYYVSQGDRLLELGQPEAAYQQFQKAIDIKRNSPEAWKGRGDALLRLGRERGALESYEVALSLAPNNPKTLNNKGKVLYNLGQYEQALATHDRVLQIDPDNVNAWSGKGVAYIGLGQYEKASQYFDKAQKSKPDEPTVWLEEGLAIENLNPQAARESYEEALRVYEELAKKQPNNPLVWTDRGFILLKLNRHQEALDSYQKALDIDDNFYEALVGKANALSILGNHKAGLEVIDKATQIRPEDHQIWHNRGGLLARLGKWEEALTSFEKAINLRNDFAPAWEGKGAVLGEQKKYREALTVFDKLKILKSKDPWVWANRGGILEELGRDREALNSYDRAIELDRQLNILPPAIVAARDKLQKKLR